MFFFSSDVTLPHPTPLTNSIYFMALSLQTLSCLAPFSGMEILHKHLFTMIHVPFLCLLKHHPVSPDVFIRNYKSIKSLKSVSLSCAVLLPPCQRPLEQNRNGKITLSCTGWKRDVLGRESRWRAEVNHQGPHKHQLAHSFSAVNGQLKLYQWDQKEEKKKEREWRKETK